MMSAAREREGHFSVPTSIPSFQCPMCEVKCRCRAEKTELVFRALLLFVCGFERNSLASIKQFSPIAWKMAVDGNTYLEVFIGSIKGESRGHSGQWLKTSRLVLKCGFVPGWELDPTCLVAKEAKQDKKAVLCKFQLNTFKWGQR